jgi:hypothetical protein
MECQLGCSNLVALRLADRNAWLETATFGVNCGEASYSPSDYLREIARMFGIGNTVIEDSARNPPTVIVVMFLISGRSNH